MINRNTLRQLFSPILNPLESGEEEYIYKNSYRTILVAIGVLFGGLASAVLWFAIEGGDAGYYLPVLVFSAIGLLCIIVAWLGSDRAVARIWKAGR